MTASLCLRQCVRADLPTLISWFQTEREVVQWAGAAMPWPLTTWALKPLIKAHRGSHPSREVWSVIDARDTLIGHFQFGCNYRLRTMGLGRVALAPDRRGEGLGHALIALAVDYAFSKRWVHRLDLLVYTHNRSAIRTYQNIGFVLEGTRRQTTPIGDEIWDTHMMSILRTEFENKIDKRTERE